MIIDADTVVDVVDYSNFKKIGSINTQNKRVIVCEVFENEGYLILGCRDSTLFKVDIQSFSVL